VWRNFFSQTKAIGVELVHSGGLPREHLNKQLTTAMLGLPAVVVLRSLQVFTAVPNSAVQHLMYCKLLLLCF